MQLSEGDLRLIGFWVADCAERVLPLFEAKSPSDTRPRDAIEGIRIFARGEKRTAHLRSLVWAAYASAREIGDAPAATFAARAAGLAAASAYTHALATLDQGKHVLGPAVHAARARELSTPDDVHASDEEIAWAIARATPEVREIALRWPTRSPGRTRLDTLYYQLDAGLRSAAESNVVET